jgi:hypothetical protein
LKEFDLMFGYIEEFVDYYKKLLQLVKYDEESNEAPCQFTYQSNIHHDLFHLQTKYSLEAIAGTADDLSKFKNLATWLNKRHPHDNVQQPEICNAIEVLQLSVDNAFSANCYVLATVLNELFLSLGYCSRRVHCRSYDAYDLDSHVVTVVYSDALEKWVYFDPSWNCYVTDDKGIILGLEEFRERLSANLPVWVNGDPIDSEWSVFYKGYMAKNMFWFICPTESEYNYEHTREEKEKYYCVLLPKYFIPIDMKEKLENKQYRICRNPKNFWIAPNK